MSTTAPLPEGMIDFDKIDPIKHAQWRVVWRPSFAGSWRPLKAFESCDHAETWAKAQREFIDSELMKYEDGTPPPRGYFTKRSPDQNYCGTAANGGEQMVYVPDHHPNPRGKSVTTRQALPGNNYTPGK